MTLVGGRMCAALVAAFTLAPVYVRAQGPAPTASLAQHAVSVAGARGLPRSALRVRERNEWRTWWRSASAPARWEGSAVLARDVSWRPVATGVEWGELVLAGAGEAWRTRVVVARVDPKHVRVELDTAFTPELRAAWRVTRARPEALVALNAGQFVETLPWGWVVLDGRRFLSPAGGPLSTAVVVDSVGTVRWLHGDSAITAAAIGAPPKWAFQSYPTLLRDGEVPSPLRAPGSGVDVAHRDARAAIGRLADGRLLLIITRFDGLGRAGGFIPFGLTTPETAALMGALGAVDAVMLDGGISAQMRVRSDGGAPREWRALRAVPLGLVVLPK